MNNNIENNNNNNNNNNNKTNYNYNYNDSETKDSSKSSNNNKNNSNGKVGSKLAQAVSLRRGVESWIVRPTTEDVLENFSLDMTLINQLLKQLKQLKLLKLR